MHAQYGDLSGNAAVHALLEADDLRFRLDENAAAPSRNVSGDCEQLLLEAACERDERARRGVGRASTVARAAPRARVPRWG